MRSIRVEVVSAFIQLATRNKTRYLKAHCLNKMRSFLTGLDSSGYLLSPQDSGGWERVQSGCRQVCLGRGQHSGQTATS